MPSKGSAKRPPYIGEDRYCHIPLQDETEAICDANNIPILRGRSWAINENLVIYAKVDGKNITFKRLLFPKISFMSFTNGNKRDYRSENISECRKQCWIEGDICYIPLTQGKIAVCDASRFDEVNICSWSLNTKTHVRGKVNGRYILLHRYLFPNFALLDHISRDSFDNRACNIREATWSENIINRGRLSSNTTGYKGVVRESHCSTFKATITKNGNKIRLGNYKTKEEAARAYDAKAKELHGEFAVLNFPEENIELDW